MSEFCPFPNINIGDVAQVRSGYAFKSKDWVDYGVPVIKIRNVKDGDLVMDGCSFVDQSIANTVPEWHLKRGDILIAMTGYIGEVARIRDNNPKLLNQRVGRFDIFDQTQLDPIYFFYCLMSKDIRLTIESLGYGSAQPNVSPALIHDVEIPLPPLPEQQAIASILGALDDKIDLNRRMNETLESMARAIFKSWFVDFDPVRAKMEGKQPYGMDAETAALFPDRLVESELGLIPEGWEVTALVDQCQIVMGQSPPGETYNETRIGIPFYQGKRDFGDRFPTRRVYCTAPTRHAISGSTLLSVRAPVGTVNQAWEDCAIGRGLASLMHKSGHTEITYQICLALQEEFKVYESEGTVFGSINKSSLSSLQIISPSDLIVTEFEKTAGKLGACIRNNAFQSRTLAELRDLLLPKLLSGEIRVKEAEQMVEAAV